MTKKKTLGRGRPKGRSVGAAEYVRFTEAQSTYLDQLERDYATRAEAVRACVARCMKLDKFEHE